MSGWRRVLGHPAAPPAFLVLAGLLVFGPHAPRSGLHLDDHALHRSLARADWAQIWDRFLTFVPGRNLDMLYQGALYKLLGPSVARQHWVGLALDALNALLAYALFRRLRLGRAWSLAAAGLFLVWPNHAETHFWLFAVVQNLLSTTFTLAAFVLAGSASVAPGARAAGALALYALGLFDYDQPFFLWVPLLVYTRLAPGAALGRRREAWLAAGFLALNVVHVLLRLFVPVSSGGRPMITFGLLLGGLRQSLAGSLVPIRKLPVWENLQSWAGGPVPTLLLVLALSGLWLACAAAQEESDEAPPLAPLALFGTLWFFAAYAPNYFWYVSPRHNYLPSLGLALVLACAARALGPRAAKALAAAAFLAFGLGAASGLAEGRGWALTAELHERFRREAPPLLPPAPDNLFLLGAPLAAQRAPAFQAPEEASSLYEEATGRFPAEGALTLAPGRTGAFFGAEVELFGWDNLRRRPYEGMNALLYRPDGSLACVGRLDLADAGRPLQSAALNGRCPGTAALDVPVWLEASRRAGPAAGAPAAVFSNGAELLSISARDGRLELVWRAPRGGLEDFAAAVALRDAGGRTLFEPVFRAAPRTRPLLWPFFNELAPPSSWPAGRVTRESWRVRLPALPAGPLEASVTLFERRPGIWRRLETKAVPLEAR